MASITRQSPPPAPLSPGVQPNKQRVPHSDTGSHGRHDEGDAEQFCRICRCPSEARQPLYHPCKCTGSIRYCHQDCLKEWLAHSRKGKCELCNHSFTFHKVYSQNMPEKLPWLIQATFLIGKFASWTLFLLRCIAVAFLWLAFVPWAHITFLRASFEAVDMLVWLLGDARSTWSGVGHELINATHSGYSTSAPATLSSLQPQIAQAALHNLTSNITFTSKISRKDRLIALAAGTASNFTLAFASGIGRTLQIAALFEPTGILGVCLGIASGIASGLRGSYEDWQSSRLVTKLTNDIFLGQILTCGIVIVVLSAWFTREWVIMQLPAHVPDLAEEQQPPQARAEPPAVPPTNTETATPWAIQQAQSAQVQEPSLPGGSRAEQFARGSQDRDMPESWRIQEWDRIVEQQSAVEEQGLRQGDEEENDDVKARMKELVDFDADDESYQDIDVPRAAHLAHFGEGLEGTGTSRAVPKVRDWARRQSPSSPLLYDNAVISFQGGVIGSEDLGDIDALDSPDVAYYHDAVEEGASRSDEATNSDDDSELVLENEAASDASTEENTGDQGRDALRPTPQEPEQHQALFHALRVQDALRRDEADGLLPGQQPLAPLAAAAAAAVDQAPPPLQDQAEWDDNLENEMEGLIEAIGFRGDPVNLFANVSIVVALCFIFVVFFIAMPYLIGRMFGLGRGFVDLCLAPIRLLRMATDPAIDWIIEVTAALLRHYEIGATVRLANTGTGASKRGWSAELISISPSVQGTANAKSTLVAAPVDRPFQAAALTALAKLRAVPSGLMTQVMEPIELKVSRASTMLTDRALCIALGHAWWMTLLAFCLLVEDSSRRPGHAGSQQRPSWWLRELVGQTLIVGKVLFFLLIEIIVFPLGCGLVLDISTCPLFGATLAERYASFLATPLSSAFIRWAVGTFWMFRFGLYVRHVRSILRPGVLSWIRDPEDPDFQPIKEILDRGSAVQLRKIGASALMYAVIILALFGVNVWAAWLALPASWAVFPLRQGPSQSPSDVIVILLVTPFFLEHSKWEQTFSKLSSRWWRMAAYHTGLAHFFLDSNSANRACPAIHQVGGQDAQHTFLARVAASDNAIIGSPMIIELDEMTGKPVTERGKEALREQLEKIEQMSGPKAKYSTLRLPRRFGKRVILTVAMLWGSMSLGIFSLLIPLTLGRKITSGSQADSYALFLGVCAITPPCWCLAKVLHSRRMRDFFGSPAWGGQSTRLRRSKSKSRRSVTAGDKPNVQWATIRQKLFEARKRARKVLSAGWLVLSMGVIAPTLLGIAVDQVLISHVRFAMDKIPQTSLPYAWAMGVLEQEMVLIILPYLPEQRLQVAVRELKRRGLCRAKAWRTTCDLFLPIVLGCLAVIVTPLLISALLERALLRGEARDDGTVETLTSAARLVVLVGLLVAVLTELLLSRMGQYDRELRDKLYLQASELLNYGGSGMSVGVRLGSPGPTTAGKSAVPSVSADDDGLDGMLRFQPSGEEVEAAAAAEQE